MNVIPINAIHLRRRQRLLELLGESAGSVCVPSVLTRYVLVLHGQGRSYIVRARTELEIARHVQGLVGLQVALGAVYDLDTCERLHPAVQVIVRRCGRK